MQAVLAQLVANCLGIPLYMDNSLLGWSSNTNNRVDIYQQPVGIAGYKPGELPVQSPLLADSNRGIDKENCNKDKNKTVRRNKSHNWNSCSGLHNHSLLNAHRRSVLPSLHHSALLRHIHRHLLPMQSC